MFKMNRKRGIAFVGVIVLAISGAAYAYWTTTGGGTATATTGTDSGVTVTQNGTITALAPGSAAQAVDFTIHNPISTNQFVHSVTIAVVSTSRIVSGSTP